MVTERNIYWIILFPAVDLLNGSVLNTALDPRWTLIFGKKS